MFTQASALLEGGITVLAKCGIYRIRHKSGAAYIGGSHDLTNRYTWHRYMLRRGKHTSKDLQALWNGTLDDFVFEIVELCSKDRLREREQFWAEQEPLLVSTRKTKGWTLSEETKQRQRDSRARYLENPAARAELARRAREQHAQGKLGRRTWKLPQACE